MTIVTALIFSILSFTFLYFLRSIYSKSKAQAQYGTAAATQKLQPLPAAPLLSLRFLGRSATGWLQHVAKLNKIVQYNIFNFKYVFINDLQLGKEVFKNPIFCGRETSEIFASYAGGSYGIANTQGEKWKEQRKFTHLQLKEHGFGTKSMETFIHNEIDALIDDWCRKSEEPFSPNKEFYIPVLNSIWMMMASERAEGKENKLAELVLRVYAAGLDMFCFPDALLLFSKIPLRIANPLIQSTPFFPGLKKMMRSLADLRLYFQEIIDARKKTLKINENSQDLVDAYLKESERTTDPNSEFFGNRAEMHLMATMIEIFVAGGETTSSVLAWTMLHLIRNPDIQEKIRTEIDTVVGPDRHPSLHTDRTKCPYTEAFLLEILRFSPVTLLSLPHSPTEDANIGPYFISKNTLLFLNIYGILHDPKVWGDPENFRPDRFLSDDGKAVVRNEAMCQFSLGQRRCVGEQVARDSLFLFVSRLCQRFILTPDPKLKGIPPLRAVSMSNGADTFSMVATDRLKSN